MKRIFRSHEDPLRYKSCRCAGLLQSDCLYKLYRLDDRKKASHPMGGMPIYVKDSARIIVDGALTDRRLGDVTIFDQTGHHRSVATQSHDGSFDLSLVIQRSSRKDASVNGYPRLASCRTSFLAVALLSLLLSACTNLSRSGSPQWAEVSISDFNSIAGRWEGLLKRSPQTHRMLGDDWVQVAIGHDGEYAFESYRPIGVFREQGKLTIENGKATARTDEGRVTFKVHEADGTRMLRAAGASNDGIEYSAELRPTR
jgi:hypothetical protein